MIDSLVINNFKCFKEVKLDDLGRVNVIVGDNASGKTALLEAIYLLSGNTPENHMKLGRWRGVRESVLAVTEDDVESGEMWRDLFLDFDLDRRITMAAKGTPDRTLVIAKEKVVPGVVLEGHFVRSPVTWTWSGGRSAKRMRSVPQLNSQTGRLEFPSVPRGISGAFLAGTVAANDVAKRFSELDKHNKADPVVRAIIDEFPDILSLSLQTDQSVGHMVYASLESLGRKVPLAYISSGINWIVLILLTIASFPNGTVGIDEIDTGIFHERLPSIWKTVNTLSKESQTQLFVSTHSAEALSALASVLANDEADFRLIRVTRDDQGRSAAKVYSGRNLTAAIGAHVEVR